MDPLLLADQFRIMRISSARNPRRFPAITPVVGLWMIAGLGMAFAIAAGFDLVRTPEDIQQAETATKVTRLNQKDPTMRYMCLIHHEQRRFSEMTAEELDAIRLDNAAFDDRLIEEGKLVIAQALRPERTARNIRVRGRKVQITDGPFAESKEELIGFLLIEAADLDEAVRIASGSPLAKTGTIEVREAYEGRDDI